MKIKYLTILIFVFLLCDNVIAQETRLTNLKITNTRDDLLIYLSLEGAFREKLKKAVHSGVPATFSYFIKLTQVRSMWPDKTITELKITSSVKYDNLKKEYKITRSWKNKDATITHSFEEAQLLMTDLNHIKLYPLNGLEKGKNYRIQAKAEVSKITLPFYLHYVLLFVSLWDIETDWYTINFIF